MYYRPATLSEALAIKSSDSVQILAGGTDFYPALRDRPVTFPVLDTTAIIELRHIQKDKEYWSFGANATWTDIINAPLPAAFDALKLAAREVGSIQIQNRGTIAGNLCNASPAADGVPPLLVLDAVVEIASSSRTRHQSLASFIQGNRKTTLTADEIVTRILVPLASAKGTSAFLKLGARKYLVISIAMVAVRIEFKDEQISTAAVAVGACAETAKRLPAVESKATGLDRSKLKTLVIEPSMLAPLSPIDDVRAPAKYRHEAVAVLLRDALAAAAS